MIYHINGSPQFKVTLNGHPLEDVVVADDEQGEATIYCHDRTGSRIPNCDDRTGFETITVKGKVAVLGQPAEEKATLGDMPESWWQACQGIGMCLKTEYWDQFTPTKKEALVDWEAVPLRICPLDYSLEIKDKWGFLLAIPRPPLENKC